MSLRAFVLARAENLLFALLLLLHLLPIWTVRYFLTTDGPAHLYNAWVTKVLLTQAQHPFHHYLAFNPVPVPNYLTSIILSGFLGVLPPWLAEKLVQTLYVIGLPWALRYMLRAWQPRAGFLALLAFPLIYSSVFQYGFYNFCLSIVLLLVILGYWRLHLYQLGWAPRRIAGLALWLLLLYFAHPLTYLVTGLVLGLFVLEQTWFSLVPEGTRRADLLRSGLLSLLLASAPSLLLLGWYLRHPTAEESVPSAHIATGKLLQDWLALEPLRFMGSAEGTYRGLIATLLLGLVSYTVWCQLRGRRVASGLAWALGAGLLVLAYVLLPDALLGGSIIRPRLGVLSYLLLIGLLSTVPYPRRLRQALVGATILLTVLLLSFRANKYRTLATGLNEYLTAISYLRPGTSLASFTYAHVTRMPNGKDYKSYIDVFPHVAGYLGVERHLLNYENYEAHTGYFPLVWRPGQALLTDRDSTPARIEWTTYPRRQWPDYVLLWGRGLKPVPTANAQQLAAHLSQYYHSLYRSPTGLLELWGLSKK